MAPKKRAATTAPPAPSKRAKKAQDDKIVEDVKKDDETVAVKDNNQAEVKIPKPEDVPLDEECGLHGRYQVYIDSDGAVYDVALNQTNASKNNNKFYRIQLLVPKLSSSSYITWTRWGRVGEIGTSAPLVAGSLDGAIDIFKKKFKDKTGLTWESRLDAPKAKKYVYLERSYETAATAAAESKAPPSKLAESVQRLVEFIFNQQYMDANMAQLDYDVEKLPLGKLSKRTIEQAYQALKELADEFHVVGQSDASMAQIEELSNRYLSLIPHDFGRSKPPIIKNDDMLKKEIDLLDSLIDMKVANDIFKEARDSDAVDINALDRQFAGLGLNEMAPLETNTKEFKELASYLHGTKGSTHALSYQIEDIFRIQRKEEFERFDESAYSKLKNSDRRLLWHGSRSSNFGGILSTGLRIAPPEAPVNGYMFDKGIYLADMSSKSANYCHHYISGDVGLLLLCEAELGSPMLEYFNSDLHAATEAKKQGRIATWGKGLTAPKRWKDAKCVHKSLKGVTMPDTSIMPGDSGFQGQAFLQYHEYIVYDVAQVRLRYLFRVKMK